MVNSHERSNSFCSRALSLPCPLVAGNCSNLWAYSTRSGATAAEAAVAVIAVIAVIAESRQTEDKRNRFFIRPFYRESRWTHHGLGDCTGDARWRLQDHHRPAKVVETFPARSRYPSQALDGGTSLGAGKTPPQRMTITGGRPAPPPGGAGGCGDHCTDLSWGGGPAALGGGGGASAGGRPR